MKVNLEELRAQLFGPPLSQEAIARFLILSIFAVLLWTFGVISLFQLLILLLIYLFLWIVG
ncbi:MAG: hypothetical protein GX182_08455 [Firmicutes bacterium]|nr:hypothetical protein [Bacillota bacterium]